MGQEVSDDIPPPEEKKLEWSGNLDAKYTVFHMDRGSALYRLQFLNAATSSAYLSQYRIEPYLNADYQTSDLGFHLKTHATYFSDDAASFDLFEAYGSYNPSFNSTLQAGKRVYNWGKGYAFNPAGYVNPVKDPENPELAQAGLLSASFEYVKSFSSPQFQTFSLHLVVIPPPPDLLNRYAEVQSTGIAVKAYALLWDTDVDIMGFYRKSDRRQIGFDLSRNLKENVEVHAELSFDWDSPAYSIVNGSLQETRANRHSYLVGFRYLHESNTTAIAEYYHNAFGMGEGEFQAYGNFLASAANSGNSVIVQQALGVMQRYFRGSTLMRDYLYLKLVVPEPFELLYFTPSLYSIYNLIDRSFLVSASLNYKPVTNVEFILWPTILTGSETSEFGGKMVRWRIEGWLRIFF
jgi:hypothetical protein